MKINIRQLLSILMLCYLASSSPFAQGFLKAKGKYIVDENDQSIILRGMGLGGWMLQEGYMLQTADFANAQYQIREKIVDVIGEEETELFYELWLQNHMREIDVDSLKSWGFNSIRLPLHYNLFTLPIEDEPIAGEHTWLTKGFELTDSLLKWCEKNEMYIILDLHAAPGGQGQDQAISDYDPTKPSLWESQANRDKTVALWRKIAEHYVDEPWIAGYDLINEPNWELPGNTLLKEIYTDITAAIREVDQNHIIFIEGNWFANDFNNLTPPWDDNLVYSPHKYWSYNDQASIQWVLDIRNNHNVPLYFGESGENSNQWFTDAITLFEENEIGWAWWPLKKIGSVVGPLTIEKTAGYSSLLNYWNGTGEKPSQEEASDILFDLIEKLKLENCTYQKDVIDAMFRQINSEETIPFENHQIPGIVYASDFDLGRAGSAYYDSDMANYHVSTGNYTAWNNGWIYRNDGVDLQESEDQVNTNGLNIGWLETGEWIQYSVNVTEEALYDISLRVAADGQNGSFHFSINGSAATATTDVPNTGGWQDWQTLTIEDVPISPSDHQFRFHVDEGGFNLGSFEFTKKGPTTDAKTIATSSYTKDNQTLSLTFNKYLNIQSMNPGAFHLTVDGEPLEITEIELDENNERIAIASLANEIHGDQSLILSYDGSELTATDGTVLEQFSDMEVANHLPKVHQIPGKIEAEEFFSESGIQLEETSDDTGQNIGYLDVGDYADYLVNIAESGTYNISFRTASLNSNGSIDIVLLEEGSEGSVLLSQTFESTGGWQTWATSSASITLPSGRHTIRVKITAPQFNLNWFEIGSVTAIKKKEFPKVNLYPNPGTSTIQIWMEDQSIGKVTYKIYTTDGKLIKTVNQYATVYRLNIADLTPGVYILKIQAQDQVIFSGKFLKKP